MTDDGRTQQFLDYTQDKPNHPITQSPIGAVMVVGGGIAGIQASLDLAEAGFKVYLVESKSAIGGHMAQLDKTFPTNDCAMCTISPKLVEAGRHLNIDILVDTEVLDVQGRAGNFTATLRRKPRYIDLSKCIGCGDCEKACPIILPDSFNENLSKRHAAHRLYPQAIPSAYAIEKRGISPCRDACPVNTRAQGYIALVREGRYDDALRVIKEENPFPGICGRICNHRCETACNRNLTDEPIAIKDLKRFIVDQVYAKPRQPIERVPRTREEKIAIIGSGPCGLTAAMDLVKQGYGVSVFEALPVAGGMLRVGVPEYRLPSAIVDREVQDIVDLGIDLRLNTTVNNLDDVFAEGFKSVLIAVGAHEGKKLRIPGVDLAGVMINTRFLRDTRLGNPPDVRGRDIVVLGGGNVAIDVARTAVRLGAAKVKMACLESREKMPSHPWEIREAEEEGVEMFPARSFTRILDDGKSHVAGVECVDVKFMEFDSEGRLTLETVEGSEHVIPCDTLIFSIGQAAGLAFLPADTGVGTTRRGTVAVNPNTLAATRPGVFAAGDAATGTAFVIDSVAAGHRAAESIHLYLQGQPLERPPRALELPVVKLTRAEIEARVARGEVHVQPRVKMAAREVAERVKSFEEVTLGYTEEEAKAEAARCLACGICSECLSCYYACGVGAILHDMVERTEQVQVGAVILAPGVEPIDLRALNYRPEFGYGRYPNVVTSLEFERLLSAGGPTLGVVKRPSDGAHPRKIAWIQCVGSRDPARDQGYCSSVCCMYATKQALIAHDHDANIEPTIFYLDLRAYGKEFDRYVDRAKAQGARYIRSMVGAVEPAADGNLRVRYALDGRPQNEEFDMVVLSVGIKPGTEAQTLARRLGLAVNTYGFAEAVPFKPAATAREGIFVAGTFCEPKDIPETVADASGAAAGAAALLAPVRGTLARVKEYPPERDVSHEPPRVGVFICHCGSNIAGYLDVKDVAEYARTLPHVIHAETNLYTCSQDSIARITEKVKEHNLNRVVVASCTPRTHEPLFQDSIRAAGLNPFLFEMANIRNQCSWVHSRDRAGATHKAKDLVRMAAARAAQLEQLYKVEMSFEHSALVIGGGPAGMTAALMIANQEHEVFLIEREAELGGNARHIQYAVDSSQLSAGKVGWHDVQSQLQEMIAQVRANPRIHVYTGAEVVNVSGYVGRFNSRVRVAGEANDLEIKHGVAIVATGAREATPHEYLYGQDARVVTQQEFEERMTSGGFAAAKDPTKIRNAQGAMPNSVVMIQCVGSRDNQRPYCSRICCQQAIKNALKLKQVNPQAQVVVLYRDIRTYGFKEDIYRAAREQGVLFLPYELDAKPSVSVTDNRLRVAARAAFAPGGSLTFEPDWVVLSAGMEPADNARLAQLLKVPLTQDGFFLEAHPKLRPVDFATEGIFLCGLAHSPRTLDESIAQAQAAAARAAIILSQDRLHVGGVVAQVDAAKCTGCLTCVRICPYRVPRIEPTQMAVGGIYGAAHIEAAACQGCGICAAECPAKAIQLLHFKDGQVVAKVEALFAEKELMPV